MKVEVKELEENTTTVVEVEGGVKYIINFAPDYTLTGKVWCWLLLDEYSTTDKEIGL